MPQGKSAAPAAAKAHGSVRESLIIAWRLLIHPTCRPAYVAHFAHATASFIAFAWLPTYYTELSKTLGMENNAATAAARGFSSVMPYVFMVIFSVSGSLVADFLLARGMNRTCKLRDGRSEWIMVWQRWMGPSWG